MTGKASQRPHLPCLDAPRQFLYFLDCPFTDFEPMQYECCQGRISIFTFLIFGHIMSQQIHWKFLGLESLMYFWLYSEEAEMGRKSIMWHVWLNYTSITVFQFRRLLLPGHYSDQQFRLSIARFLKYCFHNHNFNIIHCHHQGLFKIIATAEVAFNNGGDHHFARMTIKIVKS